MRPLVPFMESSDGQILARALVDTIREPLLVLSDSLHVIAASRSFLRSFGLTEEETTGRLFYELGGGQWQIPELRDLLENIVPQTTSVENFEVEHELPNIGLRKMLVNVRPLNFGEGIAPAILLAMEDVTSRRGLEKEKDDQQAKTTMLLREMQHRIANSLMIIASILLLKARSVASDETRFHLLDAHQRVRAIADIQRHLRPSFTNDRVEIAPYLTKLCQSLAASMVGAERPHTVVVNAEDGAATSGEAVSLGLITTELIINALKHAFTDGRIGHINVTFAALRPGWQLSVADNGVGLWVNKNTSTTVGLGTTIVESLARQLRGSIRTDSSAEGTCVFVALGPLGESNPRRIM